MVQGQNTVVIQYALQMSDTLQLVDAWLEDPPVQTRDKLKFAGHQFDSIKLEIRPLIAFRDYHSTTHENGALNPTSIPKMD